MECYSSRDQKTSRVSVIPEDPYVEVDRRSLYIVPVGSNPTGSTMQAERRKAVYDVCVQYGMYL